MLCVLCDVLSVCVCVRDVLWYYHLQQFSVRTTRGPELTLYCC